MLSLRWVAGALLWLALLAPGARADATWIEPGADGQPVVHLYFFWSLACPHCLEARPFIESIPAGRPWVKLHALELSRHPENVRHYVALANQAGQPAQYVPGMLFCGRMQTGWDGEATSGQALLAALDACRAATRSGSALDTARALPAPAISLPVLGEVSVDGFSLPLLTGLIAGLDAFNPCAFFVLLFLLSLMAHQHSRARMLAIGGVPAMLAATVLLAVAVNFYELLCTAGFPMVYTRLLTLQDLGPATHYLYLALYNLVYVIPLAGIVGVFAFTLGARKLSEREGRLLKLLSGLMMLQLGWARSWCWRPTG